MKLNYLPAALLMEIILILPGCDKKPPQDPAWEALLANIEHNRSAYEEGVFVLQMDGKRPKPILLELGRIPLDRWLKGIRAHGVRFKKGKPFYVEEAYITDLPAGLHQIDSGDDKGAFTDSKGDLVVPGVAYFSDANRRKQALERIQSITDCFDKELQELKRGLTEMTSFRPQMEGLSDQEVIEIAIKNEKWGLLGVCLEGLLSATVQGKEVQIDAGGVLPKCMSAPSARVRRSAARCSRHFKDDRLREPLSRLLDDKDPKVRFFAISAIIKQGSKGVATKLRQMSQNDPALPVREWSALAAQYLEKGVEP